MICQSLANRGKQQRSARPGWAQLATRSRAFADARASEAMVNRLRQNVRGASLRSLRLFSPQSHRTLLPLLLRDFSKGRLCSPCKECRRSRRLYWPTESGRTRPFAIGSSPANIALRRIQGVRVTTPANSNVPVPKFSRSYIDTARLMPGAVTRMRDSR
jgi:hypothetical protein